MTISENLVTYLKKYLGCIIEKKFTSGIFKGIVYGVDYDNPDEESNWDKKYIAFSVFYADGDGEELGLVAFQKDCTILRRLG
jgi:hypothetical protein